MTGAGHNGGRTLYPRLEPYRTGYLDVSDTHSLYFEECGNPNGKPAVFLHGGPGAGCTPSHRRLWNPALYRIILFDQRGAGRSKPHAELKDNTTWDLVEDLERLRSHLGVERWQMLGGSWGSTLALAYSQAYPDRVSDLILRGVFLLRPWEVRWLYQEGASRLFPDRFDSFRNHIDPERRGDLLAAYYELLTHSDRTVVEEAASKWSGWEGSILTLLPRPDLMSEFLQPDLAVSLARIEAHFFVNRGWLTDNQLLENADRLHNVPGVIVHGRYDVVTPLQNAWDLHRAWPGSELIITEDAGHSYDEPGNVDAVIRATDSFAGQTV